VAVSPPLRHASKVYGAAFSPDGGRVATASDDNAARVWDAATGQPLTPPLRHGGAVFRVAFSPDGRRLLTASDENTARVWDADTGELLCPPLKHQGVVLHAAFSPDGRRVVTASTDGTARVWELPNDDRPVEDLDQIACVLAGAQVDATGGLVPLAGEDLRRAFEALRARYPQEFACPKEAR
jgi:WD40 repeat protein